MPLEIPSPPLPAVYNDDQLRNLLLDMATAEEMQLPGFGKHCWVICRTAQRHQQSPPPEWIWILVKMVDVMIPILVEWLKKQFGDDWKTGLLKKLSENKLPWRS